MASALFLSSGSDSPVQRPLARRATEPSPERVAANRRNAQRSTGPRTPEGKARSSLNAVRHGLCAAGVISSEESPEAFEAIRQQLAAEWRPASVLELAMVDQIAELLWRRRRVAAVEVTALEATEIKTSVGPHRVSKDITRMLYRQMRSSDSALLRVQVYQTRIDRALHRALAELRRLQTDRYARDETPWCEADAFELTDPPARHENEQTNPIDGPTHGPATGYENAGSEMSV